MALLYVHKRIPWDNFTKHSLALCYISLADAKSSQMAHTKPPVKNRLALSLQLCVVITALWPGLPPPNVTSTWELNFWLDFSSASITLRFRDDLDSWLNLTTISGPDLLTSDGHCVSEPRLSDFPQLLSLTEQLVPTSPWDLEPFTTACKAWLWGFDVGKGTWIQIYDRLLGANNILPLPNRTAFKDSQVKEHT